MSDYPEGQEDMKEDAEYEMMYGIVPVYGKIGDKRSIVRLRATHGFGILEEIPIDELEKDGIFIEGKEILTGPDAKKIRDWWDKRRNDFKKT